MELIINTFGTLVSKENDNFVIKNSSAIKRIPPDNVRSMKIIGQKNDFMFSLEK